MYQRIKNVEGSCHHSDFFGVTVFDNKDLEKKTPLLMRFKRICGKFLGFK